MTTKGHGGNPTDETGGMGIIAIGMALGNSVDDRDIFSVQPQVVTTVSAPKDNDAEQKLPNGLVRTKSKKWALFGRSKSTRVKYSDRSPGQPSLPFNATVTRTISNSVVSRETLSDSSREASPPSRKPLERSLTEPGTSRSERPPQVPLPADSLQSHACPAQTLNGSPETFSRDTFSRDTFSRDTFSRDTFSREPMSQEPISQEPMSRGPFTQEPFLDVEIPSITMERYSVMFASLLERRSTTPILMRRQNTHERFRTLEEDDGENDSLQQEIPVFKRKKAVERSLSSRLPSRLDSVQSSSNSSMDTYPAVPRTSNEILADVVAKHNNEHSPAPHIVRLASVRGRNPIVPLKIQKSEDGRPQLRSKFHIESPKQGSTPTQSKFNLCDLTDKHAGQGEPCQSLCRQNGKTSSTEMDHASTAQDHGPKVTNYTHNSGTHSSSINNSDSLSDDETGEVEVETEVIHDAVQVSIARQVSVSRDQRRMLGPLRMHPVNGQCLPEAKSLMPRLIESRKDAFSTVGIYQKRERVVMRRIGGV